MKPASVDTATPTIHTIVPEPALTPDPAQTVAPFVLDVRPIFTRGEAPCQAIDDAIESLSPGQPLVLLAPFEPIPLYAKLGRLGFTHQSTPQSDGTWRVEFRR
jgi:hypothetical protein